MNTSLVHNFPFPTHAFLYFPLSPQLIMMVSWQYDDDMTMIRWVRILGRSGRPVPNFPFSTLQHSLQIQFNFLFRCFLLFSSMPMIGGGVLKVWWCCCWRCDDLNDSVKSSLAVRQSLISHSPHSPKTQFDLLLFFLPFLNFYDDILISFLSHISPSFLLHVFHIPFEFFPVVTNCIFATVLYSSSTIISEWQISSIWLMMVMMMVMTSAIMMPASFY